MNVFIRSWLGEYKNIVCDRGVRLIMIVAFVIYPFFVPMPYLPEVLKDIPVAVVDFDSSRMSRQFTRMLDSGEQIMTVSHSSNFEEEKTNFFLGKNHGIVVIPKDFQRDIMRGEEAVISVYSDAAYFLIHKQIIMGCLQASGTLCAAVEIKHLMAGRYVRDTAVNIVNPLRLVINDLFNETDGYAAYIVPAIFILLLQQTLLIGIGMLAGTTRDKQVTAAGKAPAGENHDTVPRIAGRSATYISLYMIHTIYLVFLLNVVYRFPRRGSFIDLFIFMFIFLSAVVFMGIALSYFFRRRETSIMILLFVSTIALFLSGVSWPVESMPHWLRAVSLIIPTTTGIDGFLRINQMGATLGDVWFDCLILMISSVVCFILTCIPSFSASSKQAQADNSLL